MSFFLQHLEAIIHNYPGHPPLSAYLKQYYREHPKLGSRDRKAISEAIHLFYRFSRVLPGTFTVPEIIAAGMKLAAVQQPFLEKMMQPWLDRDGGVLPEETWMLPLSAGFDSRAWLASLRKQPSLFLRTRTPQAQRTLEAGGYPFLLPGLQGNEDKDCLSLPNGMPVDQLLAPGDYVVQDGASQASMYLLMRHLGRTPATVWDVCSGAGGKSLLLTDKLPAFRLLATDIRNSILHNLRARFRQYGLEAPRTAVLDSTDAVAMASLHRQRRYDLVLCDVPCSGSGTWARTPEQFHFFQPEHLDRFHRLQLPIARNASRYVAPGGLFAYITCSVFEAENETVAQQLAEEETLELLEQRLIDGTTYGADCMFVAFFRKRGDQ